MIILVRVHGVPGRCRIPGYEVGWFEVDQVNYGMDNKRPTAPRRPSAGKEGVVRRGRAEFHKLVLHKSLDNATCEMMFHGMQGLAIPSIEIQMVETAKGGVANFPFLMLRYQDVFLSKWTLKLEIGQVTEEVEFDYMKVAIEYHSTKDGKSYVRESTRGWDLTVRNTNAPPGGSWDYKFKARGDRNLPPGRAR